jgi:hypothetical protein
MSNISCTSAASGRKRWALYPPHVQPPGLQHLQQQQQQPATGSTSCSTSSSWCTASSSSSSDETTSCYSSSSSSSDEGSDGSAGSGLTSLQWYLEVYPHLQPQQRPLEFVQHPGEVVYVPGGCGKAALWAVGPLFEDLR